MSSAGPVSRALLRRGRTASRTGSRRSDCDTGPPGSGVVASAQAVGVDGWGDGWVRRSGRVVQRSEPGMRVTSE